MKIEVVRSPASVSWWVTINGRFFLAFDRKHEATSCAEKITKEYGLA